MTPQGWQALWRFNVLVTWQNELAGIFRAVFREELPTSFLRTASQYLEQARPLLERDGGNLLAAKHLLDEAERYLRYVEFRLIAENKKRADPATYEALRSRLLALINTPVPGIGGFGVLGKTDEIEAAIDALEDAGDFAEARRWCEMAEHKLPDAIRERQEHWHATYGAATALVKSEVRR